MKIRWQYKDNVLEQLHGDDPSVTHQICKQSKNK